MAGSYWSACTLHAGVKLDIFTLLSESPATAEDLSTQSGLSERGLTMLLDALASLDLLQKKKGVYFTTAFSSEFLSKTSVKYMGHIIFHHHHLVESWSRLDVSVLQSKKVLCRMRLYRQYSKEGSSFVSLYSRREHKSHCA